MLPRLLGLPAAGCFRRRLPDGTAGAAGRAPGSLALVHNAKEAALGLGHGPDPLAAAVPRTQVRLAKPRRGVDRLDRLGTPLRTAGVVFAKAVPTGRRELLASHGVRLAVHLDDLPLEEVERVLVQKALARYAGNVSHAAQALGLSRSAMYRRLEKYGL